MVPDTEGKDSITMVIIIIIMIMKTFLVFIEGLNYYGNNNNNENIFNTIR